MTKMAKTNAERQAAYRERHKDDGTLRKQDPVRLAEYRRTIKETLLTYYGGGRCACIICGESRMDCLSVDHKKGGGGVHRRSINRQGHMLYTYLIKNGYPDGYQTLCMNCQWIKRFANKEYNHLSGKVTKM